MSSASVPPAAPPASGVPSASDRYAEAVLVAVGAGGVGLAERDRTNPEPAPAVCWAESGAMSATGASGGPPALVPAGIPIAAGGAARALRALAPHSPRLHELDGPALLGERTAHRPAAESAPARGVSVGGSCRLVACSDGWMAVNLARPSDAELIPAWLEGDVASAAWDAIEAVAATRPRDALVARGRLLGLPVAPVLSASEAVARARETGWIRRSPLGTSIARDAHHPARVVDLSSLWAGPLCTSLLGMAGAEVVKVESTHRPDGARDGPSEFYDLLNAGKQSVALDFTTREGRRDLERLIRSADLVVESARPRALRQLGIEAERLLSETPGLTWLSITGYGRSEPEASWVAFGDDATAAAGLVDAMRLAPPIFPGDALADPLTGLHAAAAACGSLRAGGGELLDVSLVAVTRFALAAGPEIPACAVHRDEAHGDGMHRCWSLHTDDRRTAVRAPRSRASRGHARALGADTQTVLDALPAC